MTVPIKRCPECNKRNTLIDITSGEMVKINIFTFRSYVGKQCKSCGWIQKTYTFIDAKTGDKKVV